MRKRFILNVVTFNLKIQNEQRRQKEKFFIKNSLNKKE